jgi:hypothetical protein
LFLPAREAADPTTSAETVKQIRSAAGVVLADAPRDRSEVEEALVRLLGSASELAASDSGTAARDRTQTAYSLAQDGSLFGADTVSAMHEAYRELNGGQAFVLPEFATVEEAGQIGREMIDAAVRAAEAGQPSEAAREVLGFLLLVTTPRTS